MQSDILTIEYFQILNFDTRSDVRDFQCFNYDPLFLPEAIMVSYCVSVHYFYVYRFRGIFSSPDAELFSNWIKSWTSFFPVQERY